MMRKLEKAFAPAPDAVRERVESALSQIHREQQPVVRQRRPALALIIAVILLLALVGGSVAASRFGVLNYLFVPQLNEVPRDVPPMVQELDVSWAQDGVTITVDEALCDGITLNLALSMTTTEEPYYVAFESIEFAGEEIRCTTVGSEMISRFLDHPHHATGVTQHVGLSVPRSRRAEGLAEVRVHLALMQTQREIVIGAIEEFGELDEDEIHRQGKALAWEWGDGSYILGGTTWQYADTLTEALGLPTRHPSSPILCAQYDGEMTVVHDVVLTFQVEIPPVRYAAEYVAAPDSPVPCEVQIAEVTPLTTLLEVWFYPQDDAAMDAWMAGNHAYLDGDGGELAFTPMSGRSYTTSLQPRQGEDGQWKALFATVLSGFETPPEEIVICPRHDTVADESGRYISIDYPEYAIRLIPKQ